MSASAPGRLERLHLALYDAAVARPARALVLVSVAVACAAGGLAQTRLDLSFRPLFADAPEEAAATARFEAEMGQPSGAHIGVVIEGPGLVTPAGLAALGAASEAAEALPHVVEVVSLARLAAPSWAGPEPSGVWLVGPSTAPEEAAERITSLRADSPPALRPLLSRDGGATLLLARLDLPLQDLTGRREVVHAFQAALEESLAGSALAESELRWVGFSVVEAGYSRLVLVGLARSLLLTTLTVAGVLWLLLRRPALVAVVLAGTSLATPATLGLLGSAGRDITMLSSVVPLMVLIIGVADALHMVSAFHARRAYGEERSAAVRGMVAEMALPCLLTSATTAAGFLALAAARVPAIRGFGVAVAVGVTLVWALNVVLVPLLLRVLPPHWLEGPAKRGERRWTAWLAAAVARRPAAVAAAFALALVACALAVPGLEVNQRFNEEISAAHPLRADQAFLERELGGFLGPEVLVRRRDGRPLDGAADVAKLRAFAAAVAVLPGVDRVESPLDLLSPEGPRGLHPLVPLREDSLLGARARELVDAEGRTAALHVRAADVGTRGARAFGAGIASTAEETLGPDHEAVVVGQWWLAQRGMDGIVVDMTRSFAASCLLVLPLVALALGSRRLLLVSLVPNLLPMLFALAFMSWTGISLRLGTATVLAIALGIAVDDTVHLLVRLRREASDAGSAPAALRAALDGVGPALLSTTIVLALGFLTMLWNPLLALRDMGLVGAATLVAALAADLVLAPALFLLTAPRDRADYVTPVARLRRPAGSATGAVEGIVGQ